MTKQSFSKHIETVHGEGVSSSTCPDCGKGFYEQLSLNRHLSRVHSEAKQPKPKDCFCDICGNVFRSKYELKKHIDIIHNGLRKHHCKECGNTYKSNDVLFD